MGNTVFIFQGFCFINVLEKIFWKNDRRCFCAQDMEKRKRPMNFGSKQNLTKMCPFSRYPVLISLKLRSLFLFFCQNNDTKVTSDGTEHLKRIWHFCLLYWIATVANIQPNAPLNWLIYLRFNICNRLPDRSKIFCFIYSHPR